ncbi:MAG: glycosyltransferase family 9 protein [Candidatus Liptonbacteria bacterium]|nr:glycosyltransferase family 9 protein [Candidatus Liptonbacteria bacterium]
MLAKDYSSFGMRFVAGLIDSLGGLFFWPSRASIDPLAVRRILFLKLDRLGDSFLATPTLEAVAKTFPRADCSLISAPWNREVFEGSPYLREVRIWTGAPDVQKAPRKLFFDHGLVCRLAEQIRELAPDLAVDLQGNPLIVRAMHRAGVPLRAGLARKLFACLLNIRAGYPDGWHQSEIYMSLARRLGYDGETPPERISIPSDTKQKATELLAKFQLQRFAVFHLGAGRSYRQWPLAQFVELARKLLADEPSLKIVLVGGINDLALGLEFIEQVSVKDRITDLVGKCTVRGTYELLSRAVLFVGSESGPMHLAGAAGIPTVAIMSEWSGIERWRPLGEKVAVVRSKPIHPCPGPSCNLNPCPNMAVVTVEEVWQAVNSLVIARPKNF